MNEHRRAPRKTAYMTIPVSDAMTGQPIGRIGNLMGALKVSHHGTQNQRFTFDEFNAEFKRQYGYALT